MEYIGFRFQKVCPRKQTSMRALGSGQSSPQSPGRAPVQILSEQWVTDTALTTKALPERNIDAFGWFVVWMAEPWWAESLSHPSSLLRQSWSRLGRQDAEAFCQTCSLKKGKGNATERTLLLSCASREAQIHDLWREIHLEIFIFTQMKQSQGITFSFIPQESFKLS